MGGGPEEGAIPECGWRGPQLRLAHVAHADVEAASGGRGSVSCDVGRRMCVGDGGLYSLPVQWLSVAIPEPEHHEYDIVSFHGSNVAGQLSLFRQHALHGCDRHWRREGGPKQGYIGMWSRGPCGTGLIDC